jgi:hypothetical protein
MRAEGREGDGGAFAPSAGTITPARCSNRSPQTYRQHYVPFRVMGAPVRAEARRTDSRGRLRTPQRQRNVTSQRSFGATNDRSPMSPRAGDCAKTPRLGCLAPDSHLLVPRRCFRAEPDLSAARQDGLALS